LSWMALDGRRAGVLGAVPRLALVAAACAFFAGCGGGREEEVARSTADLPDQEVTEFSLTETVRGEKSWTLFADRAEIYDAEGYSKVYDVRIQFFGPEGEVRSVLTARRGRVADKTKDLEAFGEVLVETSEGVRLETDSLKWDNRAGRITSDDFVTVTRDEEVLTGYGFESSPDLADIRVLRDVKISARRGSARTAIADSAKG